jgi:hypothetical protein
MMAPRTDFTGRQYRDAMVALVAPLRERGVSPADIAIGLRRQPQPAVAAIELVDDL